MVFEQGNTRTWRSVIALITVLAVGFLIITSLKSPSPEGRYLTTPSSNPILTTVSTTAADVPPSSILEDPYSGYGDMPDIPPSSVPDYGGTPETSDTMPPSSTLEENNCETNPCPESTPLCCDEPDGDGRYCCDSDQECSSEEDWGCVDKCGDSACSLAQFCCGTVCISDEGDCCDEEEPAYCTSGNCCGDNCVPDEGDCCDEETGAHCDAGECCGSMGSTCIPDGADCCDEETGAYCPAPKKCQDIPDICCPSTHFACGTVCCPTSPDYKCEDDVCSQIATV